MKLNDKTKGLLLIFPAALLLIFITLILPLYEWIISTTINDMVHTIIIFISGLVIGLLTCYGILLLFTLNNKGE